MENDSFSKKYFLENYLIFQYLVMTLKMSLEHFLVFVMHNFFFIIQNMYKHIYCVNPTNIINIYKEHRLSNRIWKRGMKKIHY